MMSSNVIYIFEAGSTKTDVLIYKNNTKTRLSLSGFNPNRQDTNFSKELNDLNIPSHAEIHFYGSGVNGDLNKKKVVDLFQSQNISANSDILGASRALLSNTAGIACILGTGANVVYFDGYKIIDNHGGYGYLIDDYGGGLELAKAIVSKWLNGDLNIKSSKAIEDYFSVSKNNFIAHFYQKKDLHILSGLCRILPKLATTNKNLSHSIQNYFDEFIGRHVYPMCKKHSVYEINIVGSIGMYYKDWLKNSTSERGVTICKSITKPIDELLIYHLAQR